LIKKDLNSFFLFSFFSFSKMNFFYYKIAVFLLFLSSQATIANTSNLKKRWNPLGPSKEVTWRQENGHQLVEFASPPQTVADAYQVTGSHFTHTLEQMRVVDDFDVIRTTLGEVDVFGSSEFKEEVKIVINNLDITEDFILGDIYERQLAFINRKIELKGVPLSALEPYAKICENVQHSFALLEHMQFTPFVSEEALLAFGIEADSEVDVDSIRNQLSNIWRNGGFLSKEMKGTSGGALLVNRAYWNSWESYRMLLKFVRGRS
jgi:hypothetical protein